jgi:hypothetical protein
MSRLTAVERLVVLLDDVRTERADGVEHHEILDDVENALVAILAAEPNVPTMGDIFRKLEETNEQG